MPVESKQSGSAPLVVSADRDPDAWERDRQIVLAQLHNLILALRTNARFGGVPVLQPHNQTASRQASESFIATGPTSPTAASPNGVSPPTNQLVVASATSADVSKVTSANSSFSSPPSTASQPNGPRTAATSAHRLTAAVQRMREALFLPLHVHRHGGPVLSEEDIIRPFIDVALSDETTEPIKGVALAALVTFLDLKCSFLSPWSLIAMTECARSSRSEVIDSQAHEAVLARILQVYVGCVRHPMGRFLGDDHIVAALQSTYQLTTHIHASELLRRTAEQAMSDIVAATFGTVAEWCAAHPTSKADHPSAALATTTSGSSSIFSTPGFQMPATSRRSNGGPAGDVPQVPPSALRSHVQVIRYICRLIHGNTATPGGSNALTVTVAASNVAMQLEGLCLAHTALFTLQDSLFHPDTRQLMNCIRNDLSRALLRVGRQSQDVVILSQLLRTMHLLVSFASTLVIPQIGSFLTALHLRPLKLSSGASIRLPALNHERQELLLESLLEFCSDASFPVFVTYHFDLSLEFTALFEALCTFLSQSCVRSEVASGPSALDGSAGGTLSLMDGIEGSSVNAVALGCLFGLVSNQTHRLDIATEYGTLPLNDKVDQNVRRIVSKKAKEKERLCHFLDSFVQDPKKALKQLFAAGSTAEEDDPLHLPREPSGWDVGFLLFQFKSLLHKGGLGEMLGEQGKFVKVPTPSEDPDGSKLAAFNQLHHNDEKIFDSMRFYETMLIGFMSRYQFKGKPLLTGIRELVYEVKLPGEAQKIDRMMEAFAKQWFIANRDAPESINPFKSTDAAFVLAFSTIMLNTDQHSGKLQKTMSKEDFLRMNRGIDKGGASLPDDYLGSIYDEVRGRQIVLVDMITDGFTDDVLWLHAVDESHHLADSLHHARVFMRGNAESVMLAVDPVVHMTLWRPATSAFTNVIEACVTSGDLRTCPASVSSMCATVSQLVFMLNATHPRSIGIMADVFEAFERLSRSAALLGNTGAVDYICLVLLRMVPLTLLSGFVGIVEVGRQPRALMALRCLFRVASSASRAMLESWKEVCHLIVTALHLGLFASAPSSVSPSLLPPTSPTTTVANASPANVMTPSKFATDPLAFVPQGPTAGSGATSLAAAASLPSSVSVLDMDPGLAPPPRAQDVPEPAGWFSGLWGSGTQTTVVHHKQRQERELERQMCILRVRDSLPALSEVVSFIATLPTDALVKALSGATHTMVSVRDRLSVKDLIAQSYTAHFVAEIVSRNGYRAHQFETLLRPYIKALVPATFDVVHEHHHTIARDGNVNSSSDGVSHNKSPTAAGHVDPAVYQLVQSAAKRALEAVVAIATHFATAAMGHASSTLPGQQHPPPPVAGHLYQMSLHIFQMLSQIPRAAFTLIVAGPLVDSMTKIVSEIEIAAICDKYHVLPRDDPHWPGQRLVPTALWSSVVRELHACLLLGSSAVRRAAAAALLRLSFMSTAETSHIGALCAALSSVMGPVDFAAVESDATDPVGAIIAPWLGPDHCGMATRRQAIMAVCAQQRSMPDLALYCITRFIDRADDAEEPDVLAAFKTTGSAPPSPASTARRALTPEDKCLVWSHELGTLSSIILATSTSASPNSASVSSSSRISSDAFLALQHVMLDPQSIAFVSSQAVADVFDLILFPLVNKLCLPTAASAATSSHPTSSHAPGVTGHFLSPSVILANMFGGAVLATNGGVGAEAGTTGSVASSGTTTSSSLGLSVPRNDEVATRVVSMLGKAFLHFFSVLSTDARRFIPTWQRVMGTLYALHSSTAAPIQTAAGGKNADADEASTLLREAVQESVRNAVLVLVSMSQLAEHRSSFAQYPVFWEVTKQLIRPFDFAESLLLNVKAGGY